ncbi:MAG: alpha/beta fold hydrolase [Gemmatimonadaceae bacterium]
MSGENQVFRWPTRAGLTTALLVLGATTLRAQSGVFEQDSTLDNLQHAPGYVTAPLGTLGQVVRRGSGPTDVLIIAGWGFGAAEFERFMHDNRSRYRMVAVTLPGFAGTAAPPMPPAGTSYGDATWTRAAQDAIVRVIQGERLRDPVVVGHFVVGTQLALRLALDHPDLVGGVVVVGGEPMRFLPSRRDSTGKTPMPRDERVSGVDAYLAPRWFKTVTKKTWNANNYAPPQYARDSTRGAGLWKTSSDVPLPVMIRYLCEYYAMDLRDEFPRLAVETRVLVPSFSPQLLADPTQSYVKPLFLDSWDMIRGTNPRIDIRTVPDSRIFITEDHPDVVRDAIDDVARTRSRQ